MFQGEVAIKIDDKGRMTIPTAMREQIASECGNRLILGYDPFEGRCLMLYPEDELKLVRQQVMGLSRADKNARLMQRRFLGSIQLLEVDGNHRLTLPYSFRKTIKLEKNAVLIGMGNKLELWSEKGYLEQAQEVVDESNLSDAIMNIRF